MHKPPIAAWLISPRSAIAARPLRALRTGGYEGLTALTDRAKAGGQLRADFSPEDLVLLYMAIAGITRHAGPAAPAAADRFIALTLDGFRAAAASAGAPPPIAPWGMTLQLREHARAPSPADSAPARGRPRVRRRR